MCPGGHQECPPGQQECPAGQRECPIGHQERAQRGYDFRRPALNLVAEGKLEDLSGGELKRGEIYEHHEEDEEDEEPNIRQEAVNAELEQHRGAIAVLGIASAWAIRARAGRRRRWLADVRADTVPGWRLTRSMPVEANGSPSPEAALTLVSQGDAAGYRDASPRDVSASSISEEEVSDAPGKYIAEHSLLTAALRLLLCAVVMFFVVGYFAAVMRVGGA